MWCKLHDEIKISRIYTYNINFEHGQREYIEYVIIIRILPLYLIGASCEFRYAIGFIVDSLCYYKPYTSSFHLL